MASVSRTFTLDATSPLIFYQGLWQGHCNTFNGSTLHPSMSSNQSGSFAAFNFTGSEVRISGVSNPDVGPFRVSLDGQGYGPFSDIMTGNSSDPTRIDLFQAANLSQTKSHTIVIVNDASSHPAELDYLGLLSISWVSDVFSQNDTRFQDTIFSYEPNSAWSTDTAEFPGSDNGNIHYTSHVGASATISFFGDRIAIYGFISSLGSPYTAQLDDGPIIHLTGNRPNLSNVPEQVLYQTTGLDSRDIHHLILTALPAEANQIFSIDYAIVDSHFNPSPSSSEPVSTVSATPSESPKHLTKLRGPLVLVGICIGGALLLLYLLILILVRFRRNRRRRMHMERRLARHPLAVLTNVYKIEPLRFSGSFSRHLSAARGGEEAAVPTTELNIDDRRIVQHWYTRPLLDQPSSSE